MRTSPHQGTLGEPAMTIAPNSLSESEFLDYVLDELRTGRRQAQVRFTDEDLQAFEDERIGEHFCRYPFLY